uniref:hypothetical protein n=1 Tax=Streptomyces sp. rh254 TaxID=3028730 RepID=UPI003C7ACEF4
MDPPAGRHGAAGTPAVVLVVLVVALVVVGVRAFGAPAPGAGQLRAPGPGRRGGLLPFVRRGVVFVVPLRVLPVLTRAGRGAGPRAVGGDCLLYTSLMAR